MYAVWIKIDEKLPWIELVGEYQTKREAKKAAEEFRNGIKIKIAKVSESRESVKTLAKATH